MISKGPYCTVGRNETGDVAAPLVLGGDHRKSKFGLCYVRNDSPFSFEGSVAVRLLDLLTGKAMEFGASDSWHEGAKRGGRSLSLPAGARTSKWFCASQHDTSRAVPTSATVAWSVATRRPTAEYNKLKDRVLVNRRDFIRHVGGNETACMVVHVCDAEVGRTGFTFLGSGGQWRVVSGLC
jgi:hypothetical protein